MLISKSGSLELKSLISLERILRSLFLILGWVLGDDLRMECREF